MKTEPQHENRCSDAFPKDASVHQFPEGSIKALAFNVLHREEIDARALPIRDRLHWISAGLGIPARVVDELSEEELAATAEQAAWCEGRQDAHGDPLAMSLLVFYLKMLDEGN